MTKKSKTQVTVSAALDPRAASAPAATKIAKKTIAPKALPPRPVPRLPAKRTTPVVTGGSKIDSIQQMLAGKQGASIEQLSKATGWQHHSVRGAISASIKKKLGLKVISERLNGTRTYRIAK